MPTTPPSTRTVIERALDETIARLSRQSPTPEVRGFLIEARRLRSLMATWRAIPPPPEARREMLAKVMHLAAAASTAVSSSRTAVSAPLASSPDVAQEGEPAPAPPAARNQTMPAAAYRVPSSASRRVSLAPGISVLDSESVAWRPLGNVLGVLVKCLHHDPTHGRITSLVRLDPGATLPAHRHAQT